MTVYERVKAMTLDEMNDFLHWVYTCGNINGFDENSDDEIMFFGAKFLKSDESALARFDDEKWSEDEKAMMENLEGGN